MLSEIKTLLWLQWRLTISMFRSRRLHVWARLGRILLMLVILLTTLPLFAAMGVGLAIFTAQLSAPAAFELLIMANSAMLLFWLVLPASYSSQIIERFEMTRLFVHPLHFRSLVTGSTLVSLLSLVGVWTILLLLGEIAGLVWQRPLALPLILLGAVPTFVTLVLTGRLMDDLFDLVSSDRRLRGLLIFVLSLPFILLLFGNYYVQFTMSNSDDVARLFEPLLQGLPPLENLEFFEGASLILTHLRPSRLLLWFPPGWATAGMALVVAGRWLEGLAFLALSVAFCAGLWSAHVAITRRLMAGALVRVGEKRIRRRDRERSRHLPGPPRFWALFHKDWAYLRRSPSTLRVLIATPFIIVAFGLGLWQLSGLLEANHPLRQALPALAAALALGSINFGTSTLTANYFGYMDREGLAGLLVSPVDRRYVLLSANAATLLLALAQSLIALLLVAILMDGWRVLPWGLYLAICIHLGTVTAYNLSSLLAPYRGPEQVWGGNSGNLGVLIAGAVALPPVLALFVVPYLFWPAGQILTLPLAGVYSLGLYLVTLKPVAGLLDRRAHRILEAVLEETG
ncbi:MAG: hypothetical protein PVF47_15210 [Anaerolineae bacterium]|jgi:hypothetical protein